MRGLLGPWLLVTVWVTGASTQHCSGDEDQALPFPSYRQALAPRVERSEDGLQPLYSFARWFLRAVQPNAFPGDLISRVLKNGTEDEDIAELVHYEAGYLVCVFLAVLYLLFLPITGALLLWTHYHRSPDPPSPASPSRYPRDLVVSGGLILTTLLLIIGVILAFAANSRSGSSLRPGLLHVDSNVGVIEKNLASIPQRRQNNLQMGLSELRARLKALADACSSCQLPDPSNLETAAAYLIPSMKNQLDSIPLKSVFTFHVEEVSDRIVSLLSELNSTQVLLRNSSKGFPSLLSLRQVASELRSSVRQAQDPLDRYDHARWAVAVALCFVLLVTVVLLLAAVSVGLPLLFDPAVYSRYPYARLERTALWMFQMWVPSSPWCILLMCAFSWLFIILVFLTLFIGGNAHTLLCESFTSGEIFTFLDKQEDWFTSLVVAQKNQSTPIPPRSSSIFRGCQRGESLFHSMEMNQTFDLEEFLDPIKYFEGFNDSVRNMSVSTENLKLLSNRGRQVLLKYQQTGLENYNYDAMILLLEEPVVKQNLLVFANELDQKAELPENGKIKVDLHMAAKNASLLHDLVVLQRTAAANMSRSVKTLKIISQSYRANVATALSRFNQTQSAMNAQVPLITANVSQCTLERGKEQLLRYLAWARRSILEDVLGCGWLTRSVDNIYTAVCLNVVDPWNGFWLSLGWCCAFLVPAVFLSLYVTRRLPPYPTAQPQASPAFTGNDYPDMSSLEKKQYTEKKGESNNSEGNAKSNIYMTLSELGDLNC
ncbi:unnamed protein product [Lota lota]